MSCCRQSGSAPLAPPAAAAAPSKPKTGSTKPAGLLRNKLPRTEVSSAEVGSEYKMSIRGMEV